VKSLAAFRFMPPVLKHFCRNMVSIPPKFITLIDFEEIYGSMRIGSGFEPVICSGGAEY
jgi:hypothetical protein